MARPIWRYSGGHWARTALAWLAFALILVSLADTRGSARPHMSGANAGPPLRADLAGVARAPRAIQTGSLPDPAVRQTRRLLDFNGLAAEAFGDNDVRPIIR